ncbi:hypothetical protein G6F46_010138 [Rhizopus delemar]|uniref:Reverse transcriptase domain-containing protein n=2 Tax=Rhizopus TaxID=4842 RepID=A0A9P7CKU0_9FUNG|nr:hypothetical protein G6F54_009721 [Rhizopus delemar]KAG1537763.1 hypothetical protein G6F51_010175 [Rhizopus arrhizus]KAG1506185.1 hypothetical protein G6F53_009875 [Rhizopus delemar]KAG1519925.1 hypothetical protein G6F52_008147 [Rhizopus delemar]KAG1565504.1 hypothetical protein G6F50_010010 [Rhizopus delemar]
MVWRCFWGEDFGPLEIIDTSSVDQETYINILANRFHPWLANVTVYQERGFIFREDGDSCHTGGYARWWKETHQIKGFGYWPAQSPDLSPIEHVWNALERRIERKRSPVKKLEQLKVALREEWERIDDEFAYRLVRSMKRRYYGFYIRKHKQNYDDSSLNGDEKHGVVFVTKWPRGDYTKATVKFSRIRKNRAIKPSFSTSEGPQNAAEIMAQYFKHIFASDLLPHSTDTILITNDSTPDPYDVASCPITIDSVNNAIAQPPRRKAPSVDHLTIEMIAPLTDNLTPILVHLFQLCWRKILEKCLYLDLVDQSPPLDITQDGFREARGTIDQALCLIESCSILRKRHRINPTLAFLDIKSAYNTVDRSYIWRTLQPCLDSALLDLLKNLFNEVQIEVILDNAKSSRFSPKTGVLQGSILSPFLYSIYINQLPSFLRAHPLPHKAENDPVDFALSVNCLLYADDVVLIAFSAQLPAILQKCEEHSYQLGYRWNPVKCTILAPPEDTQSYTLYDTILPKQNSFSYLGIPIRPGGYFHTQELIQGNINKVLKTMNETAMIGVNPAGFDRLLSVRFYTQIVHPQLEYGLVISMVKFREFQKTEYCQNQCLRRMFGGWLPFFNPSNALFGESTFNEKSCPYPTSQIHTSISEFT